MALLDSFTLPTSDLPEARAGVPGHGLPATSCLWGTRTSPAPVPLPSGPLQPVPSSHWDWLGDNSAEPTCLNRVLCAGPRSSPPHQWLVPAPRQGSHDHSHFTAEEAGVQRQTLTQGHTAPKRGTSADADASEDGAALQCHPCLPPSLGTRAASRCRSQGLLGQAGRALPCPTASSKPVPRPPRGAWQVTAPHFPKEQIKLREGTNWAKL